MTIDGTNISTYGLRVIAFDNYYSQPARKKILTEPEHTGNSMKYENKQCQITLFGEYATLPLMYSNIESFKAKVKNIFDHTWVMVGHNETFTGIVDGMPTEIIQNAIKLKLNIKITE